MISRAKIEMIVANPPNKMLSKLMHSLSVIDVKVVVTSQLSVAVKLRSPSLMEFPQKLPTLDSEEFAYQPDPDEDDDSNYDQEGYNVECNYIRLASLNYISVVKCTFSQYEEKDNWRKIAIFHTFTKIGGKK